MPNRNTNEIEKSKLFVTLFAEAENRDEYHVAGLKIEIAEQIYEMMEKKHVTQSDLARRLGKNRAYISKILKGTTNFTVETLVKIARRLDATWDFQLSEAKEKEGRVYSFERGWKEPMIVYCGSMEQGLEEYQEAKPPKVAYEGR